MPLYFPLSSFHIHAATFCHNQTLHIKAEASSFLRWGWDSSSVGGSYTPQPEASAEDWGLFLALSWETLHHTMTPSPLSLHPPLRRARTELVSPPALGQAGLKRRHSTAVIPNKTWLFQQSAHNPLDVVFLMYFCNYFFSDSTDVLCTVPI